MLLCRVLGHRWAVRPNDHDECLRCRSWRLWPSGAVTRPARGR
jgi:hypothetical protein